ncbi:hypothetical protein Adeg_1064 [Ammonifex degensii KC4]|uniref:EF-hand domain-containing protein n=1 Tax=Ammonifex degensii (strain DSM 10501 / KC4) TaxID=429009 RepID=C9RD65_AMMDK|nr:hypothetical protein [Ammonifex degensii]ACX52192.1 hypothetical protein Adeg_1064 [Ammonifex degensii KC4]
MRFKSVLIVAAVALLVVAGAVGVTATQIVRAGGDPGIAEYQKIDANKDGYISKKELFAHREKVVSEKHKAALEAAKRGGKKENFVTITFNRPLSLEEFARFVNETGLKVRFYEARVIDHQGLRGTMFFSVQNGKLLPDETDFSLMLSDSDYPNKKKKFLGIIDVIGYLDVEKFTQVQSDPRVFLVDNSCDELFVHNPKHKYMPSLYWKLEDFGLTKGPKYEFSDGPKGEELKKILEE